MKKYLAVSVVLAGFVLCVAFLPPTPGSTSEPPLLLISGGQSSCNPFFVENLCANCHDPFGKGALRHNLTPMGLDYMAKNLGCIADATTLADKEQAKHGLANDGHDMRMGLIKEHFVNFNCQQCHTPDGTGKTPSNLTAQGLDMHVSGRGCIQCMNVIKTQAGRTDTLNAPRYSKES